MKSQRAKNAVRKLLMSIFFLECIGMTSVYSQVHEAIKPHVDCKHSIFRHDNFIGCFSADKTRVRDKDCVKNRVKRAKIVRFTLC